MNLSAVKGKMITPEEQKNQNDRGLCMYSVDSTHFVTSCPKKSNAASGQVEINAFKEDKDDGKG